MNLKLIYVHLNWNLLKVTSITCLPSLRYLAVIPHLVNMLIIIEYDGLLHDYMTASGFTLGQDLLPPKAAYLQVRVVREYGSHATESGSVMLTLNSVHLLARRDAELLIKTGVLVEQAQ
jgi:hypothetical protein